MVLRLCRHWLRRYSSTCLVTLIIFIILTTVPSKLGAVTHFDIDETNKTSPALIDINDMWYYNDDLQKVIPDIDTEWVAVVFRSDFSEYAFDESGDADVKGLLLNAAKELISGYEDIVDVLYDENLAEDACFLKLRPGIDERELGELISAVNGYGMVRYSHPTMRIHNKTYGFFNAFTLEWKTGVSEETKDDLLHQAGAWYEAKEDIYRVDVFEMAFFKSLQLLSEDIRVLRATPYLVELKHTITAEFRLGISGGNIGDVIPFSLEVIFSDIVTIDPSSLANIMVRPADIQKELFEVHFDPYDYVEVVKNSPIHLTGWLKVFAPGDFEIPPVTIKYTAITSSANQVRTVSTKEAFVRISSLVPDRQKDKSLIVPLDYPSPSLPVEEYTLDARMNFLKMVCYFLAAGLCAGWFLYHLHLSRREETKRKKTRPDELIARDLALLLAEVPAGPQWTYLVEVSKGLRSYLVAHYSIDGISTGGSGEIFFAAISKDLPETLRPRFHSLFKKIDEAVALEMQPVPELEHIKSESGELLNLCKNQD